MRMRPVHFLSGWVIPAMIAFRARGCAFASASALSHDEYRNPHLADLLARVVAQAGDPERLYRRVEQRFELRRAGFDPFAPFEGGGDRVGLQEQIHVVGQEL